MWLYVPKTSSASVQEAEDWTSESDWRAQALAQSVTWNGKHSRWQTWSQRFKRVSWTRLLFGAISRPSTASRGVERWIGSLAASRVSRAAPPDSDVVPRTTGTSGLSRPASSEKSGQTSSSLKMWLESFGTSMSASGQTYKQWATALRKDYSRRLRLARRTSGNGSLSWRSPAATDSEGGTKGLIETEPDQVRTAGSVSALAYAERGAAERRGHEVGGTPGGGEGEARHQRLRADAGDGDECVAHADDGTGSAEPELQHQRRCLQEHDRGESFAVADGAGDRRNEGSTSVRCGQFVSSARNSDLGHAHSARLQGCQCGQCTDERSAGPSGSPFPPAPTDLDAWARVLAEVPALEPAVLSSG